MAHTAHDLVQDEESAVLVADRLHGLEGTLRRSDDTGTCAHHGPSSDWTERSSSTKSIDAHIGSQV